MINRLKGYFASEGKVRAKVNRPMRANIERGVSKLETRYDVVSLDRQASEAKKAAKSKFIELEASLKSSFPKGRALSQALVKLEEAYAWVSKAARVATESRQS